jgi:hypothetical protein
MLIMSGSRFESIRSLAEKLNALMSGKICGKKNPLMSAFNFSALMSGCS